MRVAFVHRGERSTFKQRDLESLRAAGHDVAEVAYASFRDAGRVRRAVRAADAAFCWFADAHAAVAVATAPRRVPVLVVVGGYEVEAIPEVPYGTFATGDRLARATVRYVLRRADVLLPVSERTRAALAARARPRGRVEVVPNGVDPAQFAPAAKVARVLTVGRFPDERTARVKGLPLLAAAARLLPDVPFTIAGPMAPEVRARLDLPPNVETRGELAGDALLPLFAESKVYAQLSVHESFGVALAEAMSAGCVPVATIAGALPELVGVAGRQRIVERFTLAARARRLDAALRAEVAAKGGRG